MAARAFQKHLKNLKGLVLELDAVFPYFPRSQVAFKAGKPKDRGGRTGGWRTAAQSVTFLVRAV